MRRRDAYDRSPAAFLADWAEADAQIRARIVAARDRIGEIAMSDAVLEAISTLCAAVGADGLRGELTIMRAARAQAALDEAPGVTLRHVREVAPLALRHRLRRNPLELSGSAARIERAAAELLGE